MKQHDKDADLFLRERERRVSVHASAFPRRLRELENPPSTIYSIGRLPDWTAGVVAVVGSRSISAYGRYCTEVFVSSLARAGLVIASGMAVGVDGLSHRVAMAHKAKTVAVLPCGPKTIMPVSHRPLAEEILRADGAIMSENPTGTIPMKFQYHRRNRILAGMADLVLVIEAGARSGTSITAGYAAELGRPLCVVPSPITNPNREGVKSLLNLGAKIVTCPEDLYEELGFGQAGLAFSSSNSNGKAQIASPLPVDSEQARVLEIVRSFGIIEHALLEKASAIPSTTLVPVLRKLQKKRLLEIHEGVIGVR